MPDFFFAVGHRYGDNKFDWRVNRRRRVRRFYGAYHEANCPGRSFPEVVIESFKNGSDCYSHCQDHHECE